LTGRQREAERISGRKDIAYLAARTYFEHGREDLLSLFEIIFRVLNDVRSVVICFDGTGNDLEAGRGVFLELARDGHSSACIPGPVGVSFQAYPTRGPMGGSPGGGVPCRSLSALISVRSASRPRS